MKTRDTFFVYEIANETRGESLVLAARPGPLPSACAPGWTGANRIKARVACRESCRKAAGMSARRLRETRMLERRRREARRPALYRTADLTWA